MFILVSKKVNGGQWRPRRNCATINIKTYNRYTEDLCVFHACFLRRLFSLFLCIEKFHFILVTTPTFFCILFCHVPFSMPTELDWPIGRHRLVWPTCDLPLTCILCGIREHASWSIELFFLFSLPFHCFSFFSRITRLSHALWRHIRAFTFYYIQIYVHVLLERGKTDRSANREIRVLDAFGQEFTMRVYGEHMFLHFEISLIKNARWIDILIKISQI